MSAGENDEPQNPLLQNSVLVQLRTGPLWPCHYYATEVTQRAARMTVSRSVLTLLLLTAAACGPRPAPSEATSVRELADIVRAYEEASNQGDAQQLASLYGDGALLLPPEGGIVSGRDSIREFWQDGLERGLTLDTVRIMAHDRDAWVVGTYQVAATDEVAADSGKYVMCFARTATGWHLMVDIWNTTASDSPDDDEQDDPRTRIIRAVQKGPAYRFRTMDQRATKRRSVDAHPTTLQRVTSRRSVRSSD